MKTNTAFNINSGNVYAPARVNRRCARGEQPGVLTDIYEEDTNIVIWQRKLPSSISAAVSTLLSSKPDIQAAMTVAPESALASLSDYLGDDQPELVEDIARLVDMFCCLFELKRAGLRLTGLDRAMCPRFHVDKVPCRLVTTYHGVATQWLPHDLVDRSQLGVKAATAKHPIDPLSNSDSIQQLNSGDVALLKGESWEGNENAGLVHRSPAPPSGETRLLLTLDFMQ